MTIKLYLLIYSHLITTNFKKGQTRMAFPSFDDPKYKATFSVKVEYSKGYSAVGSTSVLSATDQGQSIITSFRPISVPINADIVGFALCQLLMQSSLPLVPINIYHSLDTNVTTVLTSLLLMRTVHEGFFGKSAVTNHNFLAVPFRPMQTRIDNWGLHVVDELVLLRSLLTSTPEMYQETLQMYSHQFSLNSVEYEITPDTWDEWWISRGLAKFFEYYLPSKNLVSHALTKRRAIKVYNAQFRF